MRILIAKILIIILFICVLFANLFNYVAIGSQNWIIINEKSNENGTIVFKEYNLWDLSIVSRSLISTGTALDILCLILAALCLLAIFMSKISEKVLIFFALSCLVTSLLSILFISTGWYYLLVREKPFKFFIISFGWGYWLMTPCFGFLILTVLFTGFIIGSTCYSLSKHYKKKKSTIVVPHGHLVNVQTNKSCVIHETESDENQNKNNRKTSIDSINAFDLVATRHSLNNTNISANNHQNNNKISKNDSFINLKAYNKQFETEKQ